MSEVPDPSAAAVPEPFDHRTLLATLPELPGVYRMLDAAGNVLYVGKAKALKKRVASYFRENHPSPRIALMVQQIARVETTVTRSEAEALLLENNLIKGLNPRYNILFRDDKSYPYILMTKDEFPRIGYYRGSLDTKRAEYFGPYPSAVAVRESVHLLQRMFRLRTCEDSVYSNRSRPCLLYQIKRCSGPCVDLIKPAAYAEDVQLARMFLQGRQQEVIKRLTGAMEAASAELAFEQAAIYRDQITSLRYVQEKQYVESTRGEDLDVVVAVEEGGMVCVNLAMVRGGRHLGDRPHFPSGSASCPPDEALTAFLEQHYLDHPIPGKILVNLPPDDEVAGALAELAARPVPIVEPRQGMPRMWVEMAVSNARLAITARRTTLSLQGKRQQALAEALGLESIDRIECFDISHTQGEATVASCVVYAGNGMKKSEYRRFNIRDITPGDDYAAMRQAVQRRYEKVASGESVAPDLILIDGGKGQVAAAAAIMAELGLAHLPMVGVAKGEERKPGLETLIFPESASGQREPLQLPPENPALHLIQEVRDEAHRFAISGHRAARGKTRRTSRLEEIGGIGPKRRKALITHFGGLQGIAAASVEQLASIPGISDELAEKIYAALH
ncbi:MAG: excinuclease ABC subunit UvrC [Rhodocyclaceae bacterium]|nr:MAG: excinuclease ABC subunit UvrC [Rhodocyclaceae bacterium]